MKIVIVSDTHGLHDELPREIEGDLLIHCGDFETTAEVDCWFERQRFSRVLAVAGNHDHDAFATESERNRVFYNAELLTDRLVEIGGLKIFGSPWIGELEDAAYSKTHEELDTCWAEIPDETDLLITHVPPYGILDRARNGEHWGCRALADRVQELNLRLHCFGHVHASYGVEDRYGITFANASSLSGGEICNRPLTFEL